MSVFGITNATPEIAMTRTADAEAAAEKAPFYRNAAGV